jgi:hypothetical protein
VDLRRGRRSLRGVAARRRLTLNRSRRSHEGPGEDANALDARLLAAADRRASPVGTADLLRAARIGRDERAAAETRLAALEAAGRLVRSKGERWTLPSAWTWSPAGST